MAEKSCRKMDLETLHELGKGFETILKLKTKPIGIKFFAKVSDVPGEYEWINRKKAVCNMNGLSRYYEAAVAITKENTCNLCIIPDLALGMVKDVPKGFPTAAAGKFAKNPEEVAKIVQDMKKLPMEFEAIGFCPIVISPVIPDVVQIWGNPTQMMELEYSNIWNDGAAKIQLCSNGHGASCYEALSWPLATNELRLAIADSGDKRHGMAVDDDMILGVPIGKLATLYDGLVANQSTINRLPITYNFDDIDFPIPKSVLAHCKYIK
jgi:uncharacterized protein (DUF169 family)